jgi:hypothetical protein
LHPAIEHWKLVFEILMRGSSESGEGAIRGFLHRGKALNFSALGGPNGRRQ